MRYVYSLEGVERKKEKSNTKTEDDDFVSKEEQIKVV